MTSVVKRCHQLQKVAITCQKLPSVGKKLRSAAKSCHHKVVTKCPLSRVYCIEGDFVHLFGKIYPFLLERIDWGRICPFLLERIDWGRICPFLLECIDWGRICPYLREGLYITLFVHTHWVWTLWTAWFVPHPRILFWGILTNIQNISFENSILRLTFLVSLLSFFYAIERVTRTYKGFLESLDIKIT